LGSEAEDGGRVFGRFVDFGELYAQLVFGDVGAARVKDVTGDGLLELGYGGRSEGGQAYTTICLRMSSGLRMNFRVRRVTWPSDMLAVGRWRIKDLFDEVYG
jgi:hypothetical protein